VQAFQTGESSPPARLWLKSLLTPWARRAALAFFVASFFLPTWSFGVDLCPLHSVTGLPCPGCGVTRGLSAISQGHFELGAGANPTVFLLWPALVLMALAGVLPQKRVDALEARLDHLEPWFSRITRVLIGAFFGFGVIRFFYFLVSREWFP